MNATGIAVIAATFSAILWIATVVQQAAQNLPFGQ